MRDGSGVVAFSRMVDFLRRFNHLEFHNDKALYRKRERAYYNAMLETPSVAAILPHVLGMLFERKNYLKKVWHLWHSQSI